MSSLENIENSNVGEIDEDIIRELENFHGGDYLSDDFISNDEAIAKELQEEFNREYENFKKLEKLENDTSKLNVSYKNYEKYEDLDECDEELDESNEFDSFDFDWDRFEGKFKTFSFCEFNKKDSINEQINLNGQKNIKKLMNLPSNIQTGDGIISHVDISNNVLNGLKLHSQNEIHRESMIRKKDETIKNKVPKLKRPILSGIDRTSYDTVYSLLKGINPFLKQIKGMVNDGRESVIYWGEKFTPFPSYNYKRTDRLDCIIKIHKLDIHDYFLGLQEKSIICDYRYKGRHKSKMCTFNKICLWAEKEYDNLLLLQKYILCPEPIMLKNNVLVMSLIGKRGKPAPKLYDIKLKKYEYQNAYDQIVKNMMVMYKKAHLVHGNLCETNILWYKNRCYFIGLTRAVHVTHVDAFTLLKNDCKYVIDFFDRKKLSGTMTKEELFMHITGLDYNDNNRLQIAHFELKEKFQSCDDKLENCWTKPKGVKLVGV